MSVSDRLMREYQQANQPPAQPQEGLFSRVTKGIARAVLPKSLEYATGITPRPNETPETPKPKSVTERLMEEYRQENEITPPIQETPTTQETTTKPPESPESPKSPKLGSQETIITAAPEGAFSPKTKTLGKKLLDFITRPFKLSPEQTKIRNSVVYSVQKTIDDNYYKNIAKQLNVPVEYVKINLSRGKIKDKNGTPLPEHAVNIDDVSQHLDSYTKALGVGTGGDSLLKATGLMMTIPVSMGLISNPIGAGLGIASFMGLAEAESYLVSKLKGEPYKVLHTRKLSELLPSQTNQTTKDIVDFIDFLAKMKALQEVSKNSPKIIEKFTKDIITHYNLPKDVYISADKIRSIFQTGDKISPEEEELVKKFVGEQHWSKRVYRNAVKNGMTIRVPWERVVTVTDKPYWAKLKGLFHITPSSPVVNKSFAEPLKEGVRGLLPAGTMNPQETVSPSVASPVSVPPEPPILPSSPAPEVPTTPAPITPKIEPAPLATKKPASQENLIHINNKSRGSLIKALEGVNTPQGRAIIKNKIREAKTQTVNKEEGGFEGRWQKVIDEINNYKIGKEEYTIKKDGIKRVFYGEEVFVPKDLARKIYTLKEKYDKTVRDFKNGDKIKYRIFHDIHEGVIKRIHKNRKGEISSITIQTKYDTRNIKVGDIVLNKDTTVGDLLHSYQEIFVFPSSYSNYDVKGAKEVVSALGNTKYQATPQVKKTAPVRSVKHISTRVPKEVPITPTKENPLGLPPLEEEEGYAPKPVVPETTKPELPSNMAQYPIPPAYEPARGKPTWKHGKLLWNTLKNQHGATNVFGKDLTKDRGFISWVISKLVGQEAKLEALQKKYKGQRMTSGQYRKMYALFKGHDYELNGYREVVAKLKGIKPIVIKRITPKPVEIQKPKEQPKVVKPAPVKPQPKPKPQIRKPAGLSPETKKKILDSVGRMDEAGNSIVKVTEKPDGSFDFMVNIPARMGQKLPTRRVFNFPAMQSLHYARDVFFQPAPTKVKDTSGKEIQYLHTLDLGVEPYSPEEILKIEKALSDAEAEKAPDELPTKEEEEIIKKTRHYKAGTKLKRAVHIIAKQKGISTTQYHAIVHALTGRDSLSAKAGATINDARKVLTFIRNIAKVREGGKVYVPIGEWNIPLDFFNQIKNGKPTDFVSEWIDPEYHALYKAGAGFIAETMNDAQMSRMIKNRDIFNKLDALLKDASKDGVEKNIMLALNGMNVPLTKGDKAVVKYVKELEDWDLRAKNAVRQKINMPLIKKNKAYLYRMYTSSVREALKEKYSMDAGILAGMDRHLPNQVWTPTFMNRKLTFQQALEKGLETNIRTILQKQISADTRFIYLTEPIRKVKRMLPYYDYATQKHIRRWISEGFLKRQPEIDKQVNQFIKNRTHGKLKTLDEALKKIGGSQSEIKALKNILLRPTYALLFFANFTMGNRNLLQGLLDLGLIPVQDVAWGYLNIFSKQGKAILSHSKMFQTRMAYEYYGQNTPTTNIAKVRNKILRAIVGVEKAGSSYFRFIDKYPNVGAMILGSFHYFTKKGYSPSEAMFLAERNAKITQFSYLGWDMPAPFRSSVKAPFYMLKSWGLWFKNFGEELMRRLFTGKDMGGREVSIEERLGIFQYLIALALVYYGGKKLSEKIGISVWRSILPRQVFGGLTQWNPMVMSVIGLGQIISGILTEYHPLVVQGAKNMFKPVPVGLKRIYTFFQVAETGQTEKEKMTTREALLRIFFVTAQQAHREAVYSKIDKITNKYNALRDMVVKGKKSHKDQLIKIKRYNKWAIKEMNEISKLSGYKLTPALQKAHTISTEDYQRWVRKHNKQKAGKTRTSYEKLLKVK